MTSARDGRHEVVEGVEETSTFMLQMDSTEGLLQSLAEELEAQRGLLSLAHEEQGMIAPTITSEIAEQLEAARVFSRELHQELINAHRAHHGSLNELLSQTQALNMALNGLKEHLAQRPAQALSPTTSSMGAAQPLDSATLAQLEQRLSQLLQAKEVSQSHELISRLMSDQIGKRSAQVTPLVITGLFIQVLTLGAVVFILAKLLSA